MRVNISQFKVGSVYKLDMDEGYEQKVVIDRVEPFGNSGNGRICFLTLDTFREISCTMDTLAAVTSARVSSKIRELLNQRKKLVIDHDVAMADQTAARNRVRAAKEGMYTIENALRQADATYSPEVFAGKVASYIDTMRGGTDSGLNGQVDVCFPLRGGFFLHIETSLQCAKWIQPGDFSFVGRMYDGQYYIGDDDEALAYAASKLAGKDSVAWAKRLAKAFGGKFRYYAACGDKNTLYAVASCQVALPHLDDATLDKIKAVV